ncbi:suppressor of fused domain protein [Actinospongicola halichondriae]|uniref:suppressor of fused domain protein n=1 Tax=Actinospongicola halichondriae TaxID=3236844 RepID=UPI003D4480C7
MPQYSTDYPGLALREHAELFFAGHDIVEREWPGGPIAERIPDFSVLAVAPGPRFNRWTYITRGCWSATQEDGHGLEFVLSAPDGSDRHVELMTINAYYHSGPESQRLDLGHTVPIGEEWTPGSACDHLLVSLPYAYGPDLEICSWLDGHARLLSLIPITEAEREYKAAHGLEALESKLEEAHTDFSNPARESVI